MTFARLRELGTPRQWVADTLLACTLILAAVAAFGALGILVPIGKG